MLTLPSAAEPLLSRFSVGFTKPTFQRAMVLFVGFVLTLGRKTVTRTLWTMHCVCPGHFTDYHRVFSRARWLQWELAHVLAAMILEQVPADQAVVASVDDTPVQHRGKKVYGKGRHRDASLGVAGVGGVVPHQTDQPGGGTSPSHRHRREALRS